MRLDQLYTHEEMLDHCNENYCQNPSIIRSIIDRALNLGLTFRELDTLLSSAHEKGMEDAT